jgi:hypothetical protein
MAEPYITEQQKKWFASVRVRLGLALDPKASRRLGPPKKNEGWSDRNKAVVVLSSVKDIDSDLKALLKAAFDAS